MYDRVGISIGITCALRLWFLVVCGRYLAFAITVNFILFNYGIFLLSREINRTQDQLARLSTTAPGAGLARSPSANVMSPRSSRARTDTTAVLAGAAPAHRALTTLRRLKWAGNAIAIVAVVVDLYVGIGAIREASTRAHDVYIPQPDDYHFHPHSVFVFLQVCVDCTAFVWVPNYSM